MLEVLLIKLRSELLSYFFIIEMVALFLSILKRWNDLVIYLVVVHGGCNNHASLRCHIVQNKRIGYS